MVSIRPEAYRRLWWRVLEDLFARHLGPPHSLRRLRPSAECLAGSRDLEGIRRRRRWESLKSVQRSTKSHQLLRALKQLPPGMLERGTRYLERPAVAFDAALRRAPPRPTPMPAAEVLRRAFRAMQADSFLAGRPVAEQAAALTAASRPCTAPPPSAASDGGSDEWYS